MRSARSPAAASARSASPSSCRGRRPSETCSIRSIRSRRCRNRRSSSTNCAASSATSVLRPRPTTPGRGAFASGWRAPARCRRKPAPMCWPSPAPRSSNGPRPTGDADSKQQPGATCGELMALLKRAPNPFVAALEQRVIAGALQPWGVILGADMSRDRILGSICRASAAPRRGAGRAGPDPDRARPRSAAALPGQDRRRDAGGGQRTLPSDSQERRRLRRAAQSTRLS